MYKICAETFLEETFMCAPSFLVCVRLTACVCTVHAHTHSLEGTLVPSIIIIIIIMKIYIAPLQEHLLRSAPNQEESPH